MTAVAVPVIAIAAAAFASAEWVRPLGVKMEARLKRTWGGFPTTRALRHREVQFAGTRVVRRTSLEALTGTGLPSPREEREDSVAADVIYEETVTRGISRIRANRTHSTLLQAENSSYGFRRNMLAIKVPALILLGLSVPASFLVAWLSDQPLLYLILAVVQGILLLYWIVVVRETWVREQADKFAERFFVAVVDLAAPTRTRPTRKRGNGAQSTRGQT